MASLTLIKAQDLPRLISTEICHCIDTIESMDSLETKLERCFPQSVDNVFELLDEETQELYSDESSLENVIDEVYKKLLSYTPKIKTFVLQHYKSYFYRMSNSGEAVNFYEADNSAFEKKDYKNAARQYLKATKSDPKWVFPLDNLGLTYRMMGKNKKAVKYYARSLEIYPEGSYALQNQAVAYTFLGNFDKAQENYNTLIHYYPENPEGYFGIARVYILKKDYENALDYAFSSHMMYISLQSEYVKDSQEILSLIYEKLREQGKESIFLEKAKEYGINIIQN